MGALHASPSPGVIPPLLAMSPGQLDDLYRASEAGAIPDGRARGVAIVAPGTVLAPVAARVMRLFWQGKTFYATRGELLNRVTIFALRAIRAKVYKGPSRLDGRESIILDYSRTSLSARWVRDEIREVQPGVYLGYAYLLGARVISFALFLPPALNQPSHRT